MMAPHAGLERRIVAALEATPPRIPVVLGGCGTGRTTALQSLVERLGPDHCQYIDIERSASTPERFFRAITASSPFPTVVSETPRSAREAFELTLTYLSHAGSDLPSVRSGPCATQQQLARAHARQLCQRCSHARDRAQR